MVSRLLNVVFAFILILLTLPIQLIIFIILIIELKEYPIFIQERGITLAKERFYIIKFKTIKSNKKELLDSERNFLIPVSESHLTPVANFLRSKGLDELPQLFQVVIGKMNIVGPRPLMIKDLVIMQRNFPDLYEKRNSINLKPGITGLWQLFGDKKNGIKDLLQYDLLYIKKKSVITDIKIILQTIIYLITSSKK